MLVADWRQPRQGDDERSEPGVLAGVLDRRGMRNASRAPGQDHHVLDRVAKLRGVKVEALAEQVEDNFTRLFL